MRHDIDLIDRLSSFPTEIYDGIVYRATRQSLYPLAFSLSGGRWVPSREIAVLNTSLARDGALAEISYHWGQLTPLPSKPVALHEIRVSANNSLRLVQANLFELGVGTAHFDQPFYTRTQEIGAAAAFIGADGLLVPSARWDCINLILFSAMTKVISR